MILNAGIGVMGTVASGVLADWSRQFEVNVFSLVATLQAALPALRESKRSGGGRVIITSSAGSVAAPPGLAAYAAAKAAVNSIAHSLKNEEPSIISVAIHVRGLYDCSGSWHILSLTLRPQPFSLVSSRQI